MNAPTLVVPIDVVGLCVGENDEQQATNGFAGATAVYVEQATSKRAAYLGDNVMRGYDDPPWDQLELGIHLHWALPDGLTRGSGPSSLPPAPNRWLVTRCQISGTTLSTRSWLLESDALAAQEPPPGVSAVTLPVKPATLPQGFGYLGGWQALDENKWTTSLAKAGPSLADAAGAPLSAVSNGEVAFAAYYPSCRGVFGFWDDLTDLKPPASSPAELMYTIIGWFDDTAHDPVRAGATPAALEASRGWTFTAGPTAPSASLYYGVVQGIAWSPQTDYIHGQRVQEPISAQAAIGNTASEALAAYFTALEHPDVPLFETLLDAFQSGLLNTFTQPTENDLTALEERLHDQRFAGTPGGTVYSIVSKSDQGPDPRELIDLPPQLADALDRLNTTRRQADQCAFHADWFRWQLFADWYRIFMIDPAKQNEAYAIAAARYGAWDILSKACATLGQAAETQRAAVAGALGPNMRLRAAPATPFVQPSEPAVLITGDDVDFPARYGDDGRFTANGYLTCRLDDQLVSEVKVGATTLTAASLGGVTAPAGVPNAAAVTALLRESCLLSTTLLAARSGQRSSDLQTALQLALEGKAQTTYTFTGQRPSPVAVGWWAADQWLPLFAAWTVEYLPLQATASQSGSTQSYGPTIVTANFTLDQDAGGTLTYAPTGGPGSITIDPVTATFSQQYIGAGNLTPTPAATLQRLLTEYLANHADATLSAILAQLNSGAGFLIAPLNGLADALTMRQRGIQLQLKVPEGSEYAALTQTLAPIVGDAPRAGGPDFNGNFNPLRAGYMKLSLTLIDAFGQKRDVQLPSLACSASMTTVVDGTPVPSVAYLAPRLAQNSRLAFNWVAADGSGTEELTGLPAITPVCGWVLPNHVDGSLAVYDQQGRPLGTLFLEHGGTSKPIGWQSAPGDDQTIDKDLGTVMAYKNPQLREFALALGAASTDLFEAMWKVIDRVGETIEPGPVGTDADLGVLVGRPIALVQAAVRIELMGSAMLDLGWDAVGTDTDESITGVQFPVILGDLARLRDGLIGYYKQTTPGADYDLSTFYSQGADPASKSGVVKPTQTTLCVTPTPPLDPNGVHEPPDLGPCTQTVLMLVDPRAPVHATTGVLPTASIELPPDQAQIATSTLDLALFVAPVLRGAGGLSIPLPRENGYANSYVEQDHNASGALEWVLTADIGSTTGAAVWAYTPQQVREGWLRLNPIVLSFELTDADSKPVVRQGQPNALTLTITNKARRAVTFRHGAPVAEGVPPSGSIFYIHLGPLVAQSAVGQVNLAAPGWAFQQFTASQYGAYWAAAPTADTVLAPGHSLPILVTNLVATGGGAQAQVSFDYYEVDGIDDGVYADLVTIETATAAAAASVPTP